MGVKEHERLRAGLTVPGDNNDLVGDRTVHLQNHQWTWQCLIMHTEILLSLMCIKGGGEGTSSVQKFEC